MLYEAFDLVRRTACAYFGLESTLYAGAILSGIDSIHGTIYVRDNLYSSPFNLKDIYRPTKQK